MLPSICYTVRLHFAETYWEAAGAKNKAVILKFDATTDTGGQIAVQFTTVTDNAQINGIEIYAPPPQGIAAWRLLHFGTTENTGTAANDFDANGDGQDNLLEFTTGQRPHESTRAIQALVTHDETLEFTYTRANAAVPQDSYS